MIGTDERGLPLRLRSHGPIVLVASSSRGDKSPATALIARLMEQEYQSCLVAIDEADRLLPDAVPQFEGLYSLILITSEPGRLAAHVSSLHEEIAASDSSPATQASAGKANGAGIPRALATELRPGEALIWSRRPPEGPKRVRLATPGEDLRSRQVT